MCGICGIAAEHITEDDVRTVRHMMDQLRHRGPDGEGLVSGPHCCFGHTRLAVIDLEHGEQPMQTADGRFTLIFNGEIYNYLELREMLQHRGVVFRTHSDTEVLLELLAAQGAAAVESLNGMFAFALFDRQDRSILLARDPFGIKPLYWTITDDGALVFGSEIKALLEHPAVHAERDDQALQEYLTFQFCLDDRTLFRDIHKLEPGCLMRWRPGDSPDVRRYWDCNFQVDERRSEAAFQAELEVLLTDTIRLQLRSDVPVGAYLSGGLDSSIIATLAARMHNDRLSVFHGRFAEGEQYDESSYARCVSYTIDAHCHEVVPTASMFIDDLPRLMWFMDEPAAGPGLFPQYRVSKLAAEHVKVVLGGQGGDELFGGYARYLVGYLEQALKGAIFRTQEEGRHVVTLSSIVPNLAVLQQYAPLMQAFWRDGLFAPMDERYLRLIDRSPHMMSYLHPDVLAQRDQQAIEASFRRVFNHPDTKSYINKMTHFDLKTLLPALLHVEDRVSMAASLESRVPLLDVRMAELVTTAPPAQKFAGGRLKHSLRTAAGRLLPPQVAERTTKMGFPVPLNEWLHAGPVRDFVHDVLGGETARQRGIFRPEGLDEMIAREGPFGRELWGALCLELWHRQFNLAG